MKKFDSKLEQKFAQILTKAKIDWMNQYPLQGKRYDFFILKESLLIEIDGDYIHTNPNEGYIIDRHFKKKILKNDILKDIIADEAGFRLVRIWEADLKNLNHENIREFLKIK